MVSSKDVARVAGVSQSTVSRVLNNPESVKEVKRKKVLDAINHLQYQPNLIARSLITKNTRTIALVTGSLYNTFYVETTNSIVNLAAKQGFKTMVYFEGAMPLDDIFDSIVGNKIDGILMSSIKLHDPIFEVIKKSEIPYMFFNRRHHEEGNYVVLDNCLAGEIATRHILELGHQRIAFISRENDISTYRDRNIGFQKAISEAKYSIDPLLFHITDQKPESVEKIILKIMHLENPPSAIICGSTSIAFKCMDTLLSMGVRIPDDISLVGMDNVQMASHHAIQLTTAGNLKYNMGEVAIENLLEMILHGKESNQRRQIILKPELVIRKTTRRYQ